MPTIGSAPFIFYKMVLHVRVCNVGIEFRCPDADLAETIQLVFGSLPADNDSIPPALVYAVDRDPTTNALTMCREGSQPLAATSIEDLLFLLDKDLILELQHRRADLFYVHAGTVVHGGGAWAISAPSGTGKSTTVWAMVCEGLRYVSDELAPIERVGGEVRIHPYPRALNLKHEPPLAYALPPDALRFADAIYVPTRSMASTPQLDTIPLRGCLFLQRGDAHQVPSAMRLTPAEAATHLYANALNPLAHSNMGLDAAIAIVRSLPCFVVAVGSVSATVSEMRRCLNTVT